MADEQLRLLIGDDLDHRVLISHTSRQGLPYAIVPIDPCDWFFTAALRPAVSTIMPADDPSGNPW